MGAGLIPPILDLNILDEVVPVHSDQAMTMANQLWMIGLPVGVSAGAIVEAACQICERPDFAGKTAVCIIPSFGERYFTHPMFTDIKQKAEGLVKQPLPEPFDNTAFGFATPRG
jgi:cysteine synthase